MPDEVKRAFKLYEMVSSSAVKKIYAMYRSVNSDGFIRGALSWSGALMNSQMDRANNSTAEPQKAVIQKY